MATLELQNFRFEAQPEQLDDLRHRLRRTLWPDKIAAEPWRYGPPVSYMKRFVDARPRHRRDLQRLVRRLDQQQQCSDADRDERPGARRPDRWTAGPRRDHQREQPQHRVQRVHSGLEHQQLVRGGLTTSNYQRPTVYNAYPHEQIFADFTVPFAQALRWLDLTVQQRERCDPYSANNRATPPQCGTAATELPIALDLCRETRDWALCQPPASYYTAFSTIGGTYLLGWLNDNVRRVVPNENTQRYNHHVHNGTLNVSDSTCLQHSMCFANKFRGTGAGIGKGFTYTQHYYDNPKGSGPGHALSNSDQCVNTQARLETGASWATPPPTWTT